MADIETLLASTRYWTEAAAPATPSANTAVLYLDSSDGLLKWKDDAGTVYDLSATGGMTNPMTAAGDVIYSGDGSGTPARLAAGSDGEVLTLASGVPSWAAAAGGGATGFHLSYAS